ncbi:MAG: dephospho-CoA kinase [Paucimonas sp.]|nr:dephospho-CoA kinase [Paucimonas sp.]
MATEALKPHGPRFSVGLTGGIGSGKSLVADQLAARGATLVDTDRIAHALTAPGGAAMDAIRSQFGADYLTPDGALDRARMRQRVFSDAKAKKQLEAILHPLIRVETERAAQRAAGAYPVFVVPLLVESGNWRERVSRVLVIDCPEELQVERVMRRSQLAPEQVRAIMAAQATRAQRLAAADDVIVNDRDPGALEPEIDRLHALYCQLARAAEEQ